MRLQRAGTVPYASLALSLCLAQGRGLIKNFWKKKWRHEWTYIVCACLPKIFKLFFLPKMSWKPFVVLSAQGNIFLIIPSFSNWSWKALWYLLDHLILQHLFSEMSFMLIVNRAHDGTCLYFTLAPKQCICITIILHFYLNN